MPGFQLEPPATFPGGGATGVPVGGGSGFPPGARGGGGGELTGVEAVDAGVPATGAGPPGAAHPAAAGLLPDVSSALAICISSEFASYPATNAPSIMGGMSARILVVDDDTALAEMIGIVLRSDGFEPIFCENGDDAVAMFRAEQPDVILLDLMLPGKSGVDICREIRQESGVPIIMLTAKSDTVDVVLGLESGADDYVPKPFKPRELIARVRARLRRSSDATPATVRVGDLEIDVTGHRVLRGGEIIPLTPLEFDVLVTLARSPGQVFTREVLLEDVWGYRHAADTRLVNVHIQRLRSKIENDPENPEIVLTVRGVGYKAGGASA